MAQPTTGVTRELLERARAAGLTLSVDAACLVVRGPKSATAVAKKLLAHSADVVAVLTTSRASTDHAQSARDPRPDLTMDHLIWNRLLERAWEDAGGNANGVYGVLHGIRCLSACLAHRDGHWQIVGDGYEGNWHQDWQTWALPHQETVDQLLGTLDSPSLREAA